jgi:hypothetical protein
MTELEARRELLADPRHVCAALAVAIAADARLAAFREELLAADEELRRSLTEAPVPEGLAERIVLRSRYASRSRRNLALAATVAALAIGVASYLRLAAYDAELTRDRAMIEHVVENTAEIEDDAGVPPAAFRASLAKVGFAVRNPGLRVRHLSRCVIAGIESRHFVVDGPGGPISYVILPGASGRGEPERMLERDGVHALFAQRAGATIGVFTQGAASRSQLERWMRDVLA